MIIAFAVVCGCASSWAIVLIGEQGMATSLSAVFHCSTVRDAIADCTWPSVSARLMTRSALLRNLGSSTIALRPATAQNLRQRLSLATPIMIGPSEASNAWYGHSDSWLEPHLAGCVPRSQKVWRL